MKPPSIPEHPIKERIRRIKTEHDDKGKINQHLLYNETKKLQEPQINYAIYADSKSDQLFPLKPVDINFIQSYTLKDDPKFKEIRHLLQKYNEEVLRYNEKSSPGLHLKTTVIDSMLKFMRLMFQAPDGNAKKMILDVAYFWFKKNIDSDKTRKRRSVEEMEKEIRGILTQTNVLPVEVIDKELPSYKRQEELYHYQIQARTKYPQLNAPSVELEEFVTHKLGFVHQSNKDDEIGKLHKTTEELKEEKWKQRVVFKKPIIYETNYDDMDGDMNALINEQVTNNRPAEEGKEKELSAGLVNNNDTNNNLNAQQQPTDPNNPSIIEGQTENQPEQQELDIGVPDEGDAVEEEPEPEEEDKKRGKLDPLVKIFLMDRQKRIKTEAEVKREQSLSHGQNWKLEKNRIDEINAQFMTQWGGKRARFKSELSRKIQSIKAFTSISKAKEEASSLTGNPLRVENTIYKAKLNETLKEYSSYLHHEPLRKESLNTDQSMSLYDKKRVKTEASSTLRHFSSVLEDNKRLNQNTEYLDEIQRLKEKFAKYKLYTPLENFKNAIIHPEEKESNWTELDKELSEGIELPRCQMLSNPFFKVGKKKKKKGKKKN